MKSSGSSSGPTPRSPSGNAPSRKRFALTGRSHAYDPATTPARADIADIRLADRIFAPHYAAPMAHLVRTAAALTATRDGDPIGEVRSGDTFEALEITADHAWGVARPSGLVGYLPLAVLTPA